MKPGRSPRLGVFRTSLSLSFRIDRRASVTLVVLMAVNAVGTSFIGVALAWLLQEVQLSNTAGSVTAAVLGACCLTLVEVGFRLQFSLRLDLTHRVETHMRLEIARISGSLETLEHLETPTYLDRINRLRQDASWLADSCWTLLEVASIFVQISLAVALLIRVDAALGLLVVCAFPSVWLNGRARAMEQRTADAVAERERLSAHLLDMAISSRTAKEVAVSNAVPLLGRLQAVEWNDAASLRARTEFKAGLLNLCGFLVFTTGFIAGLAYVFASALAGNGNAGQVILIITLAGRLQGQIGHGVWLLSRLTRSMQVADRFIWLMDRWAAERKPGLPATPRLARGITLRRVRFRYPGTDRDILRDISLDIPAGSIVALVGANGSGKTTLVKLLCKLYTPTQGAILVDGQELGEIDTEDWRLGISGAFQDHARLEFLVRETVGLGSLSMIDNEEAVLGALDRAGGHALVTGLRNGIDTRLGPTFDGVEPSLGQWQVLALSRAAMRSSPLLLILDEPTASIDAKAEHDVFERFSAMSRGGDGHSGAITVLVSHRFSTVRMADLIVVMSAGQIAQVGTHQELMEVPGSYRDMYRAQADAYS